MPWNTHASPLRLLAAPATLLLAAALLVVGPPTPQAHGDEHDVTPARVEGETRYHTAANLATLTFDEASTAHVVAGRDFPDALATSFAAGAVDGPILLVPHDELPADHPTLGALTELGVDFVRIVGGPAAISDDVEQALADEGYDTTRIAGEDRYATATSVALTYSDRPTGTLEGDRTVLLASGEGFADALAAGPVAAGADFPLLLTPAEEPDARVDDTLETMEVDRIVVVGGPAAVSSDVVVHYEDLGYTVERWHGEDRMETAAVVADNAVERLGFDTGLVLLARGDDFPDALAASIHGGVASAPLLLTRTPTELGGATGQWLAGACPDVGAVRALGGTSAVSTTTLDAAVDAAGACLARDNNQSYVIGPQEPISAEPGWEQEFHLIGTYDDGPLQAGELALFPCEYVHRDGAYVTFAEDPDNTGHARGAGETDTDAAWISQINDVEQSTDQRRDRGFDTEEYSFHVKSEAPDCTVPVIWDTEGEQPAELEIDEDGAPTVRFGIGVVEWVEG